MGKSCVTRVLEGSDDAVLAIRERPRIRMTRGSRGDRRLKSGEESSTVWGKRSLALFLASYK